MRILLMVLDMWNIFLPVKFWVTFTILCWDRILKWNCKHLSRAVDIYNNIIINYIAILRNDFYSLCYYMYINTWCHNNLSRKYYEVENYFIFSTLDLSFFFFFCMTISYEYPKIPHVFFQAWTLNVTLM